MKSSPKYLKKKILISGAGVAGIICAILLDKNKYEIDLIEKASAFRNIGYSITLWKGGFKLLKKILKDNGEHLKAEKDYFEIKNYILYGGSKLKRIEDFNTKELAWSFERSHLMEVLEKVLFSRFDKNRILFSTTINQIKNNVDKTVVQFSKGLEKEYDIVIIAEGIHSTTRDLLFSDREKIVHVNYELRYEWFSKETNLKKNADLFFTQGHLGLTHPPYTRNLLGYYSRKNSSDRDRKQFESKVLSIIKQPDGSETSIDRSTSHVFDLKEVYLPKYNHDNIVFIGDAAHGRPPTLGFGTSLAIEDAVLISNTINNLSQTGDFKLKAEAFSKKRIKRVEEVYKFQKFIHWLLMGKKIKVDIISFLLKLFAGRYIEHRVKKMISYEIDVMV